VILSAFHDITFDQKEAFENSPGSLLVFACELFMMHICGAFILKKQTF
jgi:hypothetical protein